MNASIVQAVARHFLTMVAGGLAVKYGIDGGTLEVIISGLAAIAGVGWSVYDKRDKVSEVPK